VFAAALVAALAAGAAGAARLAPRPPASPTVTRAAPPADAPNVVLVVVDTLRADHLSCYGGTTVRTPHIDALAAEGVRYADAFSQASWTRPSIATILTGLYPSSHGAIHKADKLPDRVDTLAELLQRAGYRTVGFADNANISPAFNFQQGFDEYHYLAPDFFFGASETASQLTLYSALRLVRERFLARRMDVHNYYQPAEVVTATVRRWLDGRADTRAPLFLFVHYMDPHDPYFVHPFNGVGYARVAMPNPPAELVGRMHEAYAGSVAYLDEHLGALFDDLRRRGLWDRSLVVLTADHGEEFREHGGWWHGTTLYDEQVHVPLIVKPPGGRGARVVEEFATSLDIAPTVLAAAGASVPSTLQGHGLPLDGGPPPSRQSVFAEEDLEGNVLQAVRTRDWKLVTANPGNPRGLAPEELYDLPKDPGEHANVVASRPADAETMRAELGKSVLKAREYGSGSESVAMDPATRQRLKSLGYTAD
jgi:arylsulfatase A-like enzyme